MRGSILFRPHGNSADNCGWTAGNSSCLSGTVEVAVDRPNIRSVLRILKIRTGFQHCLFTGKIRQTFWKWCSIKMNSTNSW
jgi:hypothetical protein